MEQDCNDTGVAVASSQLFPTAEDLPLFGSFGQQWNSLPSTSAFLGGANSLLVPSANGHTTHNSSSSPEQNTASMLSGSFHRNGRGTSNLESNHSSVASAISDHSDNEQEERPKKRARRPIPSEKKDEKYWERRRKNNIAAKRSREMKRQKVDEELHKAKEAIQENQKLKQEIEVLKAEINSLRRLLKDANMTLSLWIRARQASEPTTQLPPMLRSTGNMPFVTFPVTSSSAL